MEESAVIAVEDCMNIAPDETVLVVTDEKRRSVGRAIHNAAEGLADETVYAEITADENHGAEPPSPVASAMKSSDVVLVPTTRSLTHTEACQEACDGGVRVATMPNITEQIMHGAMCADYREVASICDDLHERLRGVDELRIESDAGTSLRLEIGTRLVP